MPLPNRRDGGDRNLGANVDTEFIPVIGGGCSSSPCRWPYVQKD